MSMLEFQHIGFETRSRNKLEKHLANVHAADDSLDVAFKCTDCDETFPTIQELDRHSSVHRPVEFLCNYCDETFSNQESLDSHSASHTTLA